MENLKNDFAIVLKRMLESKTLDKITVKDIAGECGVSRQAFYYYFKDIYDIVEWIFEQEAERTLNDHQNISTWQVGYYHLLNWMKENRGLVEHTYRSIQREYIENFMYRVLFHYVMNVIEEQAVGLGVNSLQKEFIGKFYTLAFNAISLDWIGRGMKEEPQKIVESVEMIVKGAFKKALESFHT